MHDFDPGELQKNIEKMIKPIQEAFAVLSETISKIPHFTVALPDFAEFFQELPELAKNLPPRLREAATKLGKNGWTFPFELTPAETCEITENDIDLDSFFLDFYSTDGSFDSLTRNILDSEFIGPWQTVFKQCFEAYLNDQFLITIPALLCILESLLAGLLEDKRSTRLLPVCKEQLEKAQEDEYYMIEAAWISLDLFFRTLYGNHNFNGEEPLFLNRHWVLHGRSAVNWTKADALRLFVAIETIIFLLKFSRLPE